MQSWKPSTVSVRLDFPKCVQIFYISRGNKDVPETQKSAEKRPKHTSGHTSQAQKGGF